jgi:hypothetical protein
MALFHTLQTKSPGFGKGFRRCRRLPSPGNEHEVWHESYLASPNGHTCLDTELAVITEGLATAVSEMKLAEAQDTAKVKRTLSKSKVTSLPTARTLYPVSTGFVKAFLLNDYETILSSVSLSRDLNAFGSWSWS